MLRHYDEIGLLKPAETDAFTDYRYYREDQLPTIYRITALRDMGFSLTEILQILPIYEDKAALQPFFDRKKAELTQSYLETQHRLMLLDTAVDRLRKEETMNYNVTIKTIPERYAATVHMVIPGYEDEGMLWDTLCRETDQMHLVPADPCLCAATFFDNEYKEKDVEVEVSKTVKGTYPNTEHVKFRTLPAVTVASCVFKGGYDLMGDVYSTVAAWIEQNGYDYAGPFFNIYHISPHETQNPAEFVTEVCYPVVKK